MIRYFSLFFIIVLSLHALSDSSSLRRADSLIHGTKKSDYFVAYNSYKNLYLKAIIKNDYNLKHHALEGIVKSGKKLHIDVSKYEKELYKSRVHYSHKVKKRYKKTKLIVKPSYKLKYIRLTDSGFMMRFNHNVKNIKINYFTQYNSKRRIYKYTFSIHNSELIRSHTIRKKGVLKIRLLQYNLNTLRLVIENGKKLNIKFNKVSDKLLVNIKNKIGKHTYRKNDISIAPKRLDRNKIIVIDPGHGGKDPGAIGYHHYKEKNVVLHIAKYLRNILKSRGYRVYMTRDRDVFIKLSNRTKYANRKGADLFISIHANAVSMKKARKAYGIESYFLSPSRSARAERVAARENSADMSDMNRYGKQSFLNFLNYHKILAANKLAIDLQRGVLGNLRKSYRNVKDAGVREGPFWVLVGTQMPSVLVETGFITNPAEAKRLVNPKYQYKFAFGLANGVERYFLNKAKSTR